MNPLRRVLTGSGRLPDDLRAALTAEGLVVLEEGLPGSITYRNYRAPGRRSSWRKEAVSGAIVVTNQRLVLWIGKGKHMDVPHRHPLRQAVRVAVDEQDKVLFGYEAGAFGPDRSGQVEVRLRTGKAAWVAGVLNGAA